MNVLIYNFTLTQGKLLIHCSLFIQPKTRRLYVQRLKKDYSIILLKHPSVLTDSERVRPGSGSGSERSVLLPRPDTEDSVCVRVNWQHQPIRGLDCYQVTNQKAAARKLLWSNTTDNSSLSLSKQQGETKKPKSRCCRKTNHYNCSWLWLCSL